MSQPGKWDIFVHIVSRDRVSESHQWTGTYEYDPAIGARCTMSDGAHTVVMNFEGLLEHPARLLVALPHQEAEITKRVG